MDTKTIMNEKYLNLPFGNISKEKLKPWLQWLSEREISQFGSFPEVVTFFKEFFSSKKQESIHLVDYWVGDFDDSNEFIEKELLFYVLIDVFSFADTSINLLTRFSLDGTVEVSHTYLDNLRLNKSIGKNCDKIDTIIEQKQKSNKLSWKEFVIFFEEIESGLYNEELKIPDFN